MNQKLEQEIKKVDISYRKREEEYTKEQARIWNGFNQEVAKLTGIVSQEFIRVLEGISLSVNRDNIERKVKINSFAVNYNPQFFEVNYAPQLKHFIIKINDWSVDIDGKPHSDKEGNYMYCAHSYLEKVIGFDSEIDPKIAEFKKDFNVSYIRYDCGCGSDHK